LPISTPAARLAARRADRINNQTVADEPYVSFAGTGAPETAGVSADRPIWEEFTQWQWVRIKDKPGASAF
jgi:hypothetical protein